MTKDEALKMAIIEALINSLTIQDVAINACQEALEQPKEKKYLYVFHNVVEGRYELGNAPHPAMQHRPIIGKIEVQDE